MINHTIAFASTPADEFAVSGTEGAGVTGRELALAGRSKAWKIRSQGAKHGGAKS